MPAGVEDLDLPVRSFTPTAQEEVTNEEPDELGVHVRWAFLLQCGQVLCSGIHLVVGVSPPFAADAAAVEPPGNGLGLRFQVHGGQEEEGQAILHQIAAWWFPTVLFLLLSCPSFQVSCLAGSTESSEPVPNNIPRTEGGSRAGRFRAGLHTRTLTGFMNTDGLSCFLMILLMVELACFSFALLFGVH